MTSTPTETDPLSWHLTGNIGTTASTSAIGTAVNNNFIGTTDSQPLVFAANNLEAIRVTPEQNIGIGTKIPAQKLDVNGMIRFGVGYQANNVQNDYIVGRTGGVAYRYTFPGNGAYDGGNWGEYYLADAGNSTTTGTFNLGVGSGALSALSSGSSNNAFGWGAFRRVTTGSGNIGIGKQAGDGIITGSGNIAIGSGSLFVNPSGENSSNNIVIGNLALQSITGGNQNIAVGAYTSLMDPAGSYQLNIGNSIFGANINNGSHASFPSTENMNDDLIGIATPSPVETLDVQGNIRVRGINSLGNIGGIARSGNSCTNLGTISFGSDGNFYGCTGTASPGVWKQLNN